MNYEDTERILYKWFGVLCVNGIDIRLYNQVFECEFF